MHDPCRSCHLSLPPRRNVIEIPMFIQMAVSASGGSVKIT